MAAVSMLGACATKSDLRQLTDEVRALSERQDSLMTELRRDTRSTQDTLRETSDQLFSFRGDISRQLRQIAQAIATLEVMVGENQRGISSIRDQLANIRRTPVGPAQPAADTTSVVGGEPAGGDPEQLMATAMSQYNRGSLSTARVAFEEFVEAHPNHDRAPDARFYLADILSQNDRIDEALAAFLEIPSLYPTATRVPSALYRAALLQIELERMEEAEATLERIVNSYPESDAAMLARERLGEIR